MSYESEMDALRKEEVAKGLVILEKYRNATPPGILDNPNEVRDFRKLMTYIKAKRKTIKTKYKKL